MVIEEEITITNLEVGSIPKAIEDKMNKLLNHFVLYIDLVSV